MRENDDTFTLMPAENIPQLCGRATEEMAITFAASDHVVDVAVNQSEEIFGMILARFVKGKPLKNADVAFAKCLGGIYRKSKQFGERLGGLDGAFEVESHRQALKPWGVARD